MKQLVSISIVCLCNLAVCQVVLFDDAILEHDIKNALEVQGPITIAAMVDLFILETGDGVSNLKGLEYATILECMKSYNGTIQDLSPLSQLSNLGVLELQQQNIADLTSLKDLPLLLLNVQDNSIFDISPLSQIHSIEVLYLSGNNIKDISPLTSLTSLRTLYLDKNPLNAAAYSTYIPQIVDNNPGIQIFYDPIPEPVALFLLSCGFLFARQRRRF